MAPNPTPSPTARTAHFGVQSPPPHSHPYTKAGDFGAPIPTARLGGSGDPPHPTAQLPLGRAGPRGPAGRSRPIASSPESRSLGSAPPVFHFPANIYRRLCSNKPPRMPPAPRTEPLPTPTRGSGGNTAPSPTLSRLVPAPPRTSMTVWGAVGSPTGPGWAPGYGAAAMRAIACPHPHPRGPPRAVSAGRGGGRGPADPRALPRAALGRLILLPRDAGS